MNQQSIKKKYTGEKILSLLLKKVKLVVCVSLAVAILAGAAAFVFNYTLADYGGTVSFYLSKQDSADKLLPFLTSELFAERLLLDEYGLPAEFANDPEYKNQYNEAKQAIIKFNESREELVSISKELDRLNLSLTTPIDPDTGKVMSSMAEIEEKYNRLNNAYTGIYNLLGIYMSVSAEELATEEHRLQIKLLEQKLEEARIERNAFAENAYYPALSETQALENEYIICAHTVSDNRKQADNLREALLEEWRDLDGVTEDVKRITGALSFSYEIPGDEDSIIKAEKKNSTDSDKVKTPYSFLKVYVSVEGDEEFADFIIERLKTILPEYTEESLEHFYGVVNVNCTLTSPFSKARMIDSKSIVTSTALIAIVAFVAIGAVICLVILLNDIIKETKKQESEVAENSKS